MQCHERTAQPGQPVESILLTDLEACSLLRIGQRTFAELLATADWMPKPVHLGPRLRRWVYAELLDAVRNMPRKDRQPEPAQLRRARIEKLKANTVSEAHRESRQTPYANLTGAAR